LMTVNSAIVFEHLKICKELLQPDRNGKHVPPGLVHDPDAPALPGRVFLAAFRLGQLVGDPFGVLSGRVVVGEVAARLVADGIAVSRRAMKEVSRHASNPLSAFLHRFRVEHRTNGPKPCRGQLGGGRGSRGSNSRPLCTNLPILDLLVLESLN
jgi:hypothetical protein